MKAAPYRGGIEHEARLARRDMTCYVSVTSPRAPKEPPQQGGFAASGGGRVAEWVQQPREGMTPIVIDEKFLAEWVQHGIASAEIRLTKEHEFQKWLERHERT